LYTLARYTRQLADAQSERDVLLTLARTTQDLIDVQRAYVFTSAQGILYGSAATDPAETEELGEITFQLTHPGFNSLCEDGTTFSLSREEIATILEGPWSLHGDRVYFSPLVGSTACLGALALAGDRDFRLTESQSTLVEALSTQAALAIERTRISCWAAEEYCQAQEGRDELESFVYTATHALKGPLSSLRALTRILRAEASDLPEEERFQILDRVDLNARRMHRLIHELLDYANVGKADGQSERVDLTALVRSVAVETADLLRARGATLKVSEDLPVVEGSPSRLREIFRNLLENAALYGGPDPVIEVGGEAEPGCALVWVQDNGPGLAAEWLERVQKPFARGPGAKEANPEGTGMGLPIVRRIVEWHGGHLSMESTPGLGTSFHIRFPASSQTSH
jgi:signal transduction histidine kinase